MGYPAYGRDCGSGLGKMMYTVFGVVHPDADWSFLEGLDGTEVFVHFDAGVAESCGDFGGNFGVFGGEDMRTGFEELNAYAERVADGSDLCPCCSCADDEDRGWRSGPMQGVGGSAGEFPAR